MSDWVATTLGELIARAGGSFKTGPFGTALKASEYVESGVPVISVGEVSSGALVVRRDTPHVPPSVTSRLSDYLLMSGDIVFGRKGAVDRSAWVKPEEEGWFLGSDGIRVRLPGSVDSRFVAYQLQSASVRAWLLQHSGGSTLLSLNQSTLSRVKLLLPEFAEQRAIAKVLGALDDKIAANTNLVATAMELLQARYTQLLGDSPARLVTVENVVRRLVQPRRFAKTEVHEVGDYPVFDQSEAGFLGYLSGEGFLEATSEEPVLYFGDHTCKLRISTERFAVGPNTVPFVGSGVPSLVLFCALQGVQVQEEYKRHWQGLMKKSVALPSAGKSAEFASRYSGILEIRKGREDENKTLAAIRDALLPQLISGKLRVKGTDKIIEGLL